MTKFFDDDGKLVNIRSIDGLDDTELLKSLAAYGWIKEFPALVDEYGAIIVGSRRMRAAKALKMDPVVKVIHFGQGNEADAERVKLALVSNIGGKPLTKEDRKSIAENLYGKRQWTMERVALALGVDQATITRDLEGLCIVHKPPRPKGGRPKGSKTKPRDEPNRVERDNKIAGLRDAGVATGDIAKEMDMDPRVIAQILEHEDIRREAVADASAELALTMSVKEKLDAAIRMHKRKLDQEFEQRVLAESRRRMESISLPHYLTEMKRIESLIVSRKGVMKRRLYRQILARLHPDVGGDGAVFDEFKRLEKVLVAEAESPTNFRKIPSTYEELMRMKAEADAGRRARRAKAGNGPAPVRR